MITSAVPAKIAGGLDPRSNLWAKGIYCLAGLIVGFALLHMIPGRGAYVQDSLLTEEDVLGGVQLDVADVVIQSYARAAPDGVLRVTETLQIPVERIVPMDVQVSRQAVTVRITGAVFDVGGSDDADLVIYDPDAFTVDLVVSSYPSFLSDQIARDSMTNTVTHDVFKGNTFTFAEEVAGAPQRLRVEDIVTSLGDFGMDSRATLPDGTEARTAHVPVSLSTPQFMFDLEDARVFEDGWRTMYLGDPHAAPRTFWRMLYLSTTLSTALGYGDIRPVKGSSQFLAGLQAVTAVFVAGYFLARLTERRETPVPSASSVGRRPKKRR